MTLHRIRGVVVVLLGLAALLAAPFESARAAEGADTLARVRYLSSQHVYLDAGTNAGLTVGDRLEAWRGGARIAALEVIFVAGRSATGRVLDASDEPVAGDEIRRPAAIAPLELEAAAAGAAATVRERPAARTAVVREVGSPPAESLTAPPTAAVVAQARAPASAPWALASGNVSGRFASLSDSGPADRSVRELTGAATVRLRQLGGRPYDIALRVRGRRITRQEDYLSGLVEATETRDRLYELSLRYAPEDGLFGYQLGRVAVRPFVGVGYVDGLVASLRPASWLQVGGFAGVTPDVGGLTVSGDRKVGGFAWIRPSGLPAGQRLDLVVAGIREDYGDVRRDYLTAEVRHFAGPDWYLFGRTELDMDRPGGGSGLASLSVGASRRLGDSARVSVSWDRRRDSWPGAALFGELLLQDDFRSSLRGSVTLGGPRLSVTVRGGTRTGGTLGNTVHGGLSVNARTPLLWVGAGGNLFSGDLADGATVTARITRPLHGGHSLSLFYLGSRYESPLAEQARTTHRFGLEGWVELPRGLFLQGLLEKGTGADLDTTRGEIGLGIRF